MAADHVVRVNAPASGSVHVTLTNGQSYEVASTDSAIDVSMDGVDAGRIAAKHFAGGSPLLTLDPP